MKKKRERRIAMLLAMMMLIMNLIVSPVWAGQGVAINETNFPDKNFRDYVSEEFDKDNDGKLSDREIAGATFIGVYNYGTTLTDLKGIEYFTALQTLYCSGNQLSTLDISNNPALQELDCSKNQLTSLDISNNPALQKLECDKNQLTSLDISNNPALEKLECGTNQLTNLDVSNNLALEFLYCDANKLTNLDVSKNSALQRLECSKNQLTSLDISKNTALKDLWCQGNQLTSLDVSNNPALERLECDRNQLTNLDVSINTALQELDCFLNQLTTLDLSKNTTLNYLRCDDNQLTNLDLSNNPALLTLYCECNQLTNLDLSNNHALQTLYCSENQLTSLNLVNNTDADDFRGNDQTYDVKVKASDMKINYADFPGNFESTQVLNLRGATLEADDFKVNNAKPTQVTYDYYTGIYSEKINVTLNITYVYTVKFNTNGGTAINPQTITAGEHVTIPSRPTKDGYTFAGWYKDAGLTTPFNFATETINADITLYAKWNENPPAPTSYTVTFNTNGGSAVNPQTITAGGLVTKPAAPTKDGYTFAGWYKDAGLTTPFNFATETINADITLYAKWNENPPAPTSYTVTFNTNGGTAINPQTITAGGHVTIPTAPTKDGYTFAGWYKDAGLTTPFDFVNETINADTTIYAKWTQNAPARYTVTFNTNGGTAINPQTITAGGHVTIPTAPTKDGYTFAGWYKDAGLTTPFDFVNETINADTTIYAKWTQNAPTNYTVTFNTNGGSAVNPQTITAGGHVTIPTDPTKDGYTFAGWYKDAGLTTPFDFANETINADITLYAKWTQNAVTPTPEQFTITFDKNGGTGTMADVTKNKGEPFTLPACGFIPPAGKEFKAWQVDGTEKNVGDNIVLNGDKIIKAVWKDIGSVPPTPPVPPTPYTPYPWIVYPGWYYNFEAPKPKEEKPVTKMEMDWKIEFAIGTSTIDREINGVDSKIKMDVAPYIRDGRIMLPLRSLAEALGFEVEWNRSTRTVVLKDNNTRVEIPVGTNKIIVNGNVYTSDVKPEIKNNRTMLPIANLARALGLSDGKDIIWNSKSKMVTIYRSIVVK